MARMGPYLLLWKFWHRFCSSVLFTGKLAHVRSKNRWITTSSTIYMYVCCYVYSLPPCYFTQSALPIYQTGCCSVSYTCDLSRVMDFARCRLFAQLGHTFVLVSGDR